MAVITPRDIAMLLYQDAMAIDADDEACLWLIDQVVALVIPKAGESVGELSTIPPEKRPTIQRITLAVAARVWANPLMVQRRAVGPLSKSWFESNVTGIALRPDEIEELIGLDVDGAPVEGLWVMKTYTGTRIMSPTIVPTMFLGAHGWLEGEGIPLYNDGSW